MAIFLEQQTILQISDYQVSWYNQYLNKINSSYRLYTQYSQHVFLKHGYVCIQKSIKTKALKKTAHFPKYFCPSNSIQPQINFTKCYSKGQTVQSLNCWWNCEENYAGIYSYSSMYPQMLEKETLQLCINFLQ